MKKENLKYSIYSVMFGFFIMGFVDIIGIALYFCPPQVSSRAPFSMNPIR